MLYSNIFNYCTLLCLLVHSLQFINNVYKKSKYFVFQPAKAKKQRQKWSTFPLWSQIFCYFDFPKFRIIFSDLFRFHAWCKRVFRKKFSGQKHIAPFLYLHHLTTQPPTDQPNLLEEYSILFINFLHSTLHWLTSWTRCEVASYFFFYFFLLVNFWLFLIQIVIQFLLNTYLNKK